MTKTEEYMTIVERIHNGAEMWVGSIFYEDAFTESCEDTLNTCTPSKLRGLTKWIDIYGNSSETDIVKTVSNQILKNRGG